MRDSSVVTFDEAFAGIAWPVLVVSSRAGLGNFVAGDEVARRLSRGGATHHIAIEQLVSSDQVRSDFERHRWLCDHAPRALHLVNSIPFSYAAKRFLEGRRSDESTRALAEHIAAYGARTVIAANSRAALWIASLRRRRQLTASLWALVTDYGFSMGWRFQFWEEIDRIVGPVPRRDVPGPLRDRYRETPIAVRETFPRLASLPGAPEEVMITGGGWGLGDLAGVSRALAEVAPRVRQHVLCGDNVRALRDLRRAPNVEAYASIDDPSAVLARCGSVITKPGALTLAEAHAARRKIFLTEGLPGVESDNARFARERMGAEGFRPDRFAAWASRRVRRNEVGTDARL